MKYVLTLVGGNQVIVSSEQKDRILQALDAGVNRLDVNGSVVFAHSISSILPADDYIASENRRLNGRGKWMCKHGTVLHAEQRCECPAASRLTDTHGLITTVEKVECPQCHALCYADREFCDGCDANLTLPTAAIKSPASLKDEMNARLLRIPTESHD